MVLFAREKKKNDISMICHVVALNNDIISIVIWHTLIYHITYTLD